MGGVEAALVWLLEVIAKKKFGELLETGSRSSDRVMRRALEDSQNTRDEMRDAASLLERVMEQRDALQVESSRLHVENAALRAEIARLTG